MKKFVLVLSLSVCIISVSSPLQAGVSPVAGYFVSQELSDGGMINDGIVMDGRWSEAYPTGQEGEIGSAVHAASWNGTTLATMWEISGPAINATPLNYYSGTNVLGQQIEKYYTTYSGGTLVLKNTGPWWNAADAGTEYLLTVNSYAHDTTKTYDSSGSNLIRAETQVVLNATFDDNPNATVEFIIAYAILTGSGTTPLAGYPDFAIAAPGGSWGNVQKIQMEIIPEPATLTLLALGGLLLRRRI